MPKTILVTGSTDGIGFETAKMLLKKGHHVLLHGRSPEKLNKVEAELAKTGTVESYVADLSDFEAVRSLAKSISEKHKFLDVLINILVRLALDNEFEDASGKYFDNDKGRFSNPHPDALDDIKCAAITKTIAIILN